MPRVQVVFASRHGATAGIASRIAEVLQAEGAEVVLADASNHPDPVGFDAHVIGSAVYMGSWLEGGLEFRSGSTPFGNEAGLAVQQWAHTGTLQVARTEDSIAQALVPRMDPERRPKEDHGTRGEIHLATIASSSARSTCSPRRRRCRSAWRA